MIRLINFLVIGVFSLQIYGQDVTSRLLGTWMPISVNTVSGDTIKSDLYNGILTFHRENQLVIKNIGKDAEDTYTFQMESGGRELYVKGLGRISISYLSSNTLKLIFGAAEVVTYRPLEEIIEENPIEKLLLAHNWHFELEDEYLSVNFLDSIPDKVRLRDDFSNVRLCLIQKKSRDSFAADYYIWKVEKYKGHLILSIQSMEQGREGWNMYITSFNKDNIDAYLWFGGHKKIVGLESSKDVRQLPIDKRAILLTSKTWQIERLKLDPGSKSQIYSHYYVPVDTAMILNEDDFNDRRVRYHFTNDGRYAVIKGQHTIKRGIWSLTQGGDLIVLKTEKKKEYYEIPDNPLRIIRLDQQELIFERMEELHEEANSFRKIKSIQYYN